MMKKNIRLIKEVIEKFKIDFYFPHPREDYHIDNISYIKTPRLFLKNFMQNNLLKIILKYILFLVVRY